MMFKINLILLVGLQLGLCQSYKTIYQRIQNEKQYKEFDSLVRNNRNARLYLHYDPLTVFVPENEAFDNYPEPFNSNLAFYHMSFDVLTLDSLRKVRNLSSVVAKNPPLWITEVDDELFVNNAKILQDKSDYVSRSSVGELGHQQVLHVIDELLDPLVNFTTSSPNAYDFISTARNWRIGAAKTVTSFYHKVQEHNLEKPYRQSDWGYTYFVPVDSGIDTYKFKLINRYTVLSHIVPYYTLFTKPTEKNFAYESMANDDHFYTVLSLFQEEDKMYVKGITRSEENDGEFTSEIVLANIPVSNGVVHLISQPLGVFNRTLKPFPYLPIKEKLSNDPTISYFYELGQETSFNKVFDRDDSNFTYFAPVDGAFRKIEENGMQTVEKGRKLLEKHLVLSKSPYSIEQLASMTRAKSFADIELETVGGVLKIGVLKINGEYFIKRNNKYVKVVRPNYECTNGMVHVLAGPLVDLQKNDVEVEDEDQGSSFKQYWKSVNNIWTNIF